VTKNIEIAEKELVDKLFGDAAREFPIQFSSMWDAYAKEGNLLSKYIASKYQQVDAVDILDYSASYIKNIEHQNVKFHTMDNRAYISNCDKTYDLILLDSPMCEFAGGTAEHFGIMKLIVPLTQPVGYTVLIFNTSLEPYDYDTEQNQKWKSLRNRFYGKENTSSLSWQFMVPFYMKYLNKMGLHVVFYDRYARRSTATGDKTSIDLNLVVVERSE
jgi:hypothetical protein